jgi:hypothetical protein
MHLLLVLAAALLAIYLLTRSNAAAREAMDDAARPAEPDPATAGGPQFAFVSRGKLFVRAPGEPVKQIHSQYAQAAVDRVERSRRLHGWKEGTAFETSFLGRGRGQGARATSDLQVSSAQLGTGGKLLYFLRDGAVGGLFEVDLASGREQRLLHRQRLNLEDLRLHHDGVRLLGAQQESNGSARIVAINADGSDYRELTSGDTVDGAPAFVPGREAAVVFESAGLARSPAGIPLARGPASIQLLEGDGELTCVVEHPRFDYLSPRVAPDGDLLYIRRPYDPPRYGLAALMVDAALFPFRLVRAFFHYLNFFSLMYTRKPLTSASGPEVEADRKEIMLKGKRLDAEAALRKGAGVGGVPSLVPASWQLVRRSRTGAESVVASHVASFDIGPDGAILFSNGFAVFRTGAAGAPQQLLLRHPVISELAVGG